MSYAERADLILVKRVKFTCTSVHDIQNSEEKTLKWKTRSAWRNQAKRWATTQLNSEAAAFVCRWRSMTWVSRVFAALKLSMICFLKLREQLTLTAASAVFALTAASTMILAATSALTLRAASAWICQKVSSILMRESFRGRFWLRRDDGMMISKGATGILVPWKVWITSYLPVVLILIWIRLWRFRSIKNVWIQ